MRARVAELIKGLGDTLGLAGLQLNEDGCCCIAFDGIAVNFEHQIAADDILLYAKVCDAPGDPSPRYVEEILDLGYSAMLMTGGCLGLDKAGGAITFADRMALRGLDQASFEKDLEQFVDRAEGWGKLLTGPQFARVTGSGPDLAEVGDMMRI